MIWVRRRNETTISKPKRKQQNKLEALKELLHDAASYSKGFTNVFKDRVVNELPELKGVGKNEMLQGIQKAIDEIELFLFAWLLFGP